jgi:small subunit ribosomal protein S20
VELKPNDTTLVFARGDLNMDRREQQKLELLREGREAEAEKITAQLLDFQVEEYRKRVKIYPTDLNLRFKLGDLLYGKGLMDESIPLRDRRRVPPHEPEGRGQVGIRQDLRAGHHLPRRGGPAGRAREGSWIRGPARLDSRPSMAHSRTAKKAIRQNERRRLHNKAALSAMRTQVKRVRTAIAAGDTATAVAELPLAQKLLDKAAKTNRIHTNQAARVKSKLAKAVQGLG